MRTEVELLGEGRSQLSLLIITPVSQYKKELLCDVVKALLLSTKENPKKDWLFLFSNVTPMDSSLVKSMTPDLAGQKLTLERLPRKPNSQIITH